MKYGMPFMLEFSNIEESVKIAKKLNLDFVELNMCFPSMQLSNLNAKKLRKLKKQYNIEFTIHLDDNLNIVDLNPLLFKATTETVVAVIKIAKKTKIKIINLHLSLGPYITLPDERVYLYEKYLDEYLDRIMNFKKIIEKEIGNNDIIINIENLSGFTSFQILALEELLKSKCFGLTLDIGHNFCAHKQDEEFIFKHSEKLNHFHFHDCIGQKDHLAFGEGEIDLDYYFKFVNKQYVVIEVKTISGLISSINYLENKGYRS